MAFTRKSLAGIGLNEEQIEKVMTLHGTSMSDYVPRADVQAQIDDAVQKAKETLPPPDVTQTDEYKAVAEERDMLRALSGDDFAGVKPKFREAVYKMLERGEDAPPVQDQLKTVAEQFEEYFVPAQPEPTKPQFGAQVQGRMPSGEQGKSFADAWGFIPKKEG